MPEAVNSLPHFSLLYTFCHSGRPEATPEPLGMDSKNEEMPPRFTFIKYSVITTFYSERGRY